MPAPDLGLTEIVRQIKDRELTSEEYTISVLERIRRIEDKIGAFVTVSETKALQCAREIDEKIQKGDRLGRLAGVPIAVKDNICTEGLRTTCSSRMLRDFIPPYNATVTEKILQEDAVMLGKTNMDEFAMGTTTETSFFGVTRNPWNLAKVPGGSSGGSAASVAAEEATLALGSDTGGSIRCPASYCSTVGLKPTYGLISRYGLISYANSLEQIGPLTKTVGDCALLLSAISGHDPLDSTSATFPAKDYTKFLKNDIKGLKIGLPQEFYGEGIEESVEKTVRKAVTKLEDLGAICEETSLKSLDYALAAYYVIAMSEASSNLARFDGIRYGFRLEKDQADWGTVYSKNRQYGFGTEVRRRIILGTYTLSAGYYEQYYIKALKVRTIISNDFEKELKRFDILVGPTMPLPPFDIGEKIEDPLTLYACDVLTVPANLTGYPAISVPCGFVGGLPIGLQMIGKPFREDILFQAAHTFESNTAHHEQSPTF